MDSMTVMERIAFNILHPIKWKWQRLVLLCWCWQAIRPYYGNNGDGVWGDQTFRLVRLNYIRAILSLYFDVLGKSPQGAWFNLHSVRHILNSNAKYSHHLKTSEEFNDLIYRWQLYYTPVLDSSKQHELPPHRRN